MATSRSVVSLLAASTVLLAACGSGDGADPSDDAAPTVVATTSIWADIVRNVACDGLADVDTIIPPGGDPHSFEPSLRDREAMEQAELVIANGLLLEESLADTLDAVEASGVAVLGVADGLDTIPAAEGPDDHDADHDDDDDHGGDDPHVWWDPIRIAEAVPLIAEALADTGIDRAALDDCSDAYLEALAALDAEVDTIVAGLPVEERLLVTNHDSLGYFADRYGFEVVGTVIPSSSTLAATSPAELDELAALISDTGVAAIFADTQNPSDDAEALAARIGDVEFVSMLTDTLDEPGTEAGTYLGWLRANAATIVDALG